MPLNNLFCVVSRMIVGLKVFRFCMCAKLRGVEKWSTNSLQAVHQRPPEKASRLSQTRTFTSVCNIFERNCAKSEKGLGVSVLTSCLFVSILCQQLYMSASILVFERCCIVFTGHSDSNVLARSNLCLVQCCVGVTKTDQGGSCCVWVGTVVCEPFQNIPNHTKVKNIPNHTKVKNIPNHSKI